jgi:polysaccharide deacetylase 2 family uncharacterized protein YibQ
MAVPEKKRPQRKPAPRRMKKSSLKKKLPMLTIAGLLAVFVVWRTASVLLSSPEPPRPVLENVGDSGREIRKNEEKKPDMEPSRKAKAAEKPVKKEEPPAKPVPETEKKPEPAVSSQPVPQKPVPVTAARGQGKAAGRVSIVIDDVGSNMELLKEALRVLPGSVTFAVIPFQPYSRESAELLHAEGFGVILHSPMQAEDPAKCRDCISVGMTRRQVAGTLDLQFASVPHAEGLNNHTGSRATKDPVLMSYVMDELRRRKLFFLDSRTTPLTEAFAVSKKSGVRSAERKVFLDDESIESGILLKMDELALAGMNEKKAVGIGHLRPATIKVLSKRIPYWQGREIEFIPLREAVE